MLALAASGVGPVEAALIGACGAIVGGLLTSGANLLTEWRRGRREIATERRTIGRDVRRSARLSADELTEACGALEGAIGFGFYWDGATGLRTAAWQEARGVLAAELPDDAWSAVAGAYEEVRRVDRLVAERTRPLAPGRRPEVQSDDRLPEAVETMRAATAALLARLDS